nr:hypothetical protein JVH1_9234 [Rhodococcus sp. JVH1]
MVEGGYLESLGGSGTYVTGRELTGRFDLDLHKPWRQQLIAQGHDARSRMDDTSGAPVPPELERTFKQFVSTGRLILPVRYILSTKYDRPHGIVVAGRVGRR